MDQRWGNQGSKKRLKTELRFLRYLGRVWGGLGKVWGGSWEGLGRNLEGCWEGLGALWTLQGLFSIVSGLCWVLLAFPSFFLLFLAAPGPFQHCFWTLLGFVGLSQPFLALPGLSWSFPVFSRFFWALEGLCWPLLGFAVFGCFFDSFVQFFGSFGMLLLLGGERSERAKRASEALWCFLWVSIAYPCFRWHTLAFSCFLLLRFFACCLAFSFEWYFGIPSLILSSVSGCSLPSFVFSRFTLYQHFLKKIALPVHLLRQVSLLALVGNFFCSFFSSPFFTSISIGFSSTLEGFCRLKCVPKSSFGQLFGMFFWHFILNRFCINFYAISNGSNP